MVGSDQGQASAFDYSGRFALYVEGAWCPFASIEYLIEEDRAPRMAIALPASHELFGVSRRARVHLLFLDHREQWVVLFEGEMLTRGFKKSPTSQELVYVAYHVVSYMDQMSIDSLDPVAAIKNQMAGTSETNPVVQISTLTGDPFEYFRAEIVKEYLIKAGHMKSDATLDFALWVEGVAQIYSRLLGNSRLAESYLKHAVEAYGLTKRIVAPDSSLMNWETFLETYLAFVLFYQARNDGPRMSFMDLLRNVSADILHGVTVVPNAKSIAQQVQIKPNTVFNAIPPCNVIYPSVCERWEFNEDRSVKPTRLRGQFYPQALWGMEPDAIFGRVTTVFAPQQLQVLWERMVKDPGEGPILVQEGSGPVRDVKRKVQFLTAEEHLVGIVEDYLEIPRALTIAVQAMASGYKTPAAAAAADTKSVATADPVAAAWKIHDGKDGPSRLIRYWGFLSMALGAGNGIDPREVSAWGGDGRLYRRRNESLVVVDDDRQKALMVPERITLLRLAFSYQVSDQPSSKQEASRWRYLLPDQARNLRAAGCNYVVALVPKEGGGHEPVIIQTQGRNHMLFEESTALPFGVVVDGLTGADAASLNLMIPAFGVGGRSRALPEWRGVLPYNERFWFGRDTWPKIHGWAAPVEARASIANQRRYQEDYQHGPYHPAIHLTDEDKKFALSVRGTPARPNLIKELIFSNDMIGEDLRVGGWPRIDLSDGLLQDLKDNPGEATVTVTRLYFDDWDPWDGQTPPAQQATLQRVETATVPGSSTTWIRFVLDKAIVDPTAYLRVEVVRRGAPTRRRFEPKPWYILGPGATSAGRSVGPTRIADLENTTTGLLPVSTIAPDSGGSLAGGPQRNVTIGLLTPPGVSLTSAQIEAAGWLVAAVQELQATQMANASEGRRSRIKDVRPATDYFPRSHLTNFEAGMVDGIRNAARSIRNRLYADFEKWDQKRQAGGAAPLEGEPELTGTPPGTDHSVRSEFGELSRQVDAQEAVTVDEDGASKLKVGEVKSSEVVGAFAGPYLNFQFYLRRFQQQGFGSRIDFNPYLLVGYPCAVLDGGRETLLHLVAHVRVARHVITADRAFTEVTYTHVRFAGKRLHETDDGAVLPRRAKVVQDHVIPGRQVNTWMPRELLSHHPRPMPPPFVYHGGFGLGASDRQGDFGRYAMMAGYDDVGGFMFHEDFVALDEEILDLSAREVQTRKWYRPIAQVGMHSGARRSGLAFLYEDEDASFRVDGRAATRPARRLVGTAFSGAPMAFAQEIQDRVYAHARRITNREAHPG